MLWVEIDLLRGGARPAIPVVVPTNADYLAYVAQANDSGLKHCLYPWRLTDALPVLAIPLVGQDRAVIDLGASFQQRAKAWLNANDAALFGLPLSNATRFGVDFEIEHSGRTQVLLPTIGKTRMQMVVMHG